MGSRVVAKVKFDRKAYKASVTEVFGTRRASVKVGVYGDKGAEPVEVREGEKPPPITVLDLAEFHEFGLGNNPQRSFIRAYWDANTDRLKTMLLKLMEGVIARAVRSGAPISDADRRGVLEKLGLKMRGEIQARISDGIEPPLQERTIIRKGSSTPLIDTGQLRSSIDYTVNLDDTAGDG